MTRPDTSSGDRAREERAIEPGEAGGREGRQRRRRGHWLPVDRQLFMGAHPCRRAALRRSARRWPRWWPDSGWASGTTGRRRVRATPARRPHDRPRGRRPPASAREAGGLGRASLHARRTRERPSSTVDVRQPRCRCRPCASSACRWPRPSPSAAIRARRFGCRPGRVTDLVGRAAAASSQSTWRCWSHEGGLRRRGVGGAPNVRRTCSSVEASSSCVASRVASPLSQRRVAARLRPVQHSSA